MRVLLVEDDPTDREALKRFITRRNLPYEMDSVETKKELLLKLHQNKYDVILMDYNLPDSTGIDLLQVVGSTPVVMITGSGDEKIAVESIRKGAHDYLVKDQNRNYLELLPTTIENVLAHVQAKKALAERTAFINSILKSSTDLAIVATDLNFKIIYYNPMAEKIFGYTAEKAIGRTIQDIYTKEKVENSWFEKAIEIVREKGEYKYGLEKEIEDRIHYIESRVSGILDKNKEMMGFLLISRDVTENKQAEDNLKKLIHDLQEALKKVKLLSGLLPICASCKKIRDDKGSWGQIESYIKDHSEAEFTHSICPNCAKKFYPEFYDENEDAGK